MNEVGLVILFHEERDQRKAQLKFENKNGIFKPGNKKGQIFLLLWDTFLLYYLTPPNHSLNPNLQDLPSPTLESFSEQASIFDSSSTHHCSSWLNRFSSQKWFDSKQLIMDVQVDEGGSEHWAAFKGVRALKAFKWRHQNKGGFNFSEDSISNSLSLTDICFTWTDLRSCRREIKFLFSSPWFLYCY